MKRDQKQILVARIILLVPIVIGVVLTIFKLGGLLPWSWWVVTLPFTLLVGALILTSSIMFALFFYLNMRER